MRFSQAVRMADDGGHGPVWNRAKRRSGGGNPLAAVVIGALALLGTVTGGLAIKERSFAGAGATLDAGVAAAIAFGRGLVGQADADQGVEPASADPADAAPTGPDQGSGTAGDNLTPTP